MQSYPAKINWRRGDAVFTGNAYSRAHSWRFDGGLDVPASASPQNVGAPWAVAENIDPEEALTAAASSSHMMWFLYLASLAGFIVDSYSDDAEGVSDKNTAGFDWMPHITLRPDVAFSGGMQPTAADVDALHHKAHEACHIANSLRTQIVTHGKFSFER